MPSCPAIPGDSGAPKDRRARSGLPGASGDRAEESLLAVYALSMLIRFRGVANGVDHAAEYMQIAAASWWHMADGECTRLIVEQ